MNLPNKEPNPHKEWSDAAVLIVAIVCLTWLLSQYGCSVKLT